VDKEVLTGIVAESFQNISAKLRTSNPNIVGELDLLRLTQAQRAAVLRSLRLASDPRVQGLGLEVARALRDTPTIRADVPGAGSIDKQLGDALRRALKPERAKVAALQAELVPEELHEAWGHFSEDAWVASTLLPANLRLLATASVDAWVREINLTADGAEGEGNGMELPEPYRRLFSQWSHTAVSADGVAGSHALPTDRSFGLVMVAEEFKLVMKLIFLCAHMPEKELTSPAWSAFMGGHSDIDFGEVSCELGTVMDFMKMFSCPLRFGAQGLDVLRASYGFSDEGVTPLQI